MSANLKPDAPTPAAVEEMESQARSLLLVLQFFELAPGANASHVYGRARTLESLKRTLEAHLPALAEHVRTLSKEAAALRSENARLLARPPAASAPAPAAPVTPAPAAIAEPAEMDVPDDLAALMSAPFQVTPELTRRAREEPLAALAMQVARALASEGKPELERARLIAMAFAASRGDMEGFWTARRQRGGAKAKGRKAT